MMIVGEQQGAHFLLETPARVLSSGLQTETDLYSRIYKMAADSGKDTSPSPENADSRKRPLDTDIENGTTKRSHYAGGSDGVYHFKILVPSVAAGAIIGKGGETIAQLQKDTNARVKMSKANDFYPGTSERVCLISGSIESIMDVLDFISSKIREKPDLSSKQGLDHELKGGEREKQVKILVPNSTAGMIIGKGGNYIKQLKEESGAYVQISQKAKDQSLQERCITVMGDVNNNKKACAMILSKVQEDPQSGSSLNVSYADVTGPVANFNPTGSPYAHPTNQQTFSSSTLNSSFPSSQMMLGTGLAEAAGLNRITITLNLEPANGGHTNPVISQVVNSITMALHSTGYSDPATAEISSAISTLAKYGMLGIGINGNSTSGFIGMGPMDGAPTHNDIASGVFGPIGTSTSRTVLDLAIEQFRHPASGPTSPPQLNNNSFGLGKHEVANINKDTKKVDIEVAEAIVGAILGPGGRSLVEIQNVSGALIQISKKGIYAPGTRNRVVTISGTLNAISTAQYLIEQKINEEKVKRTHQNPLLMLQ